MSTDKDSEPVSGPAGDIVVGMGGWDIPSFHNVFYPPEIGRGFRKLEYYARFFDLVEINATFYTTSLSHAQAQQWLEDVRGNERFLFTLKLFRGFTHTFDAAGSRDGGDAPGRRDARVSAAKPPPIAPPVTAPCAACPAPVLTNSAARFTSFIMTVVFEQADTNLTLDETPDPIGSDGGGDGDGGGAASPPRPDSADRRRAGCDAANVAAVPPQTTNEGLRLNCPTPWK